jgi:hypothetical protein
MSLAAERVLLTAAVVAVIVSCLLLMRLGWVHRAERQGDITPLPSVPPIPPPRDDDDVSNVEARYLGATRHGDWLDRVVAHGLGVPSLASVSVRQTRPHKAGGVWILRAGAPDIFVPARDVVAARHDRAAAGRAFEADGVMVITWKHDTSELDLGLRIRDAGRAEELRVAVETLAGLAPTPRGRL